MAGNPPGSKSASPSFPIGSRQIVEGQPEEEKGSQQKWGEGSKTQEGPFAGGCLEVRPRGRLQLSHGFLLSLGESAELHLRQLDVPNHVGVCRRETHLREHLAGMGRRTVRSTQESYVGPRLFPSSSISTSLQPYQVRILVLAVTEGERSPWRDEEAQGSPRLRGEPALVASLPQGASTFFIELP